MTVAQVALTKPQLELVNTAYKYPALVAGFGAGKTNALINRTIKYKLKYPTLNQAYYLPTYDLISKIAFPRFQEALEAIGFIEGSHYKINKSIEKTITLFGGGQIIMRTMDSPGRIIGYEVADSCVDELDTLKTDDAKDVWRKIISRNRQKKPDGASNTVAVGTTPEGFRFVYENWEQKKPSLDYHLIKAPTSSNAHNLPDEYIPDLMAAYPSNLIQAYLEGKFVNLTSGAVYPDFSRVFNNTTAEAEPLEALHIGMDFNVGKMAAVVCVPRACGNLYAPHAVDELVGILDTPAMIRAIKARFPNNPIFVYPDASGANRKSNDASVSDISLLKKAEFTVVANNSNPRVKDRVMSVNSLIFVPGRAVERLLYVNVVKCPSLAEALEKQAYDKNGEPDKMSGLDHFADAIGYFVSTRFPIRKNELIKAKAAGV